MGGKAARWTVFATGSAAVALTLLPLLPSNQWWVRVWDFPRIQLAVVLALVLLATPLVVRARRLPALLFIAALAAALGWQLYRIWPYTPASPPQAEAVADCVEESRLGLLVANVLIDNETAEPLLDLVRRVEPHVLLLVETDAWWDRQLEPLRDGYPHVVAWPQDNSYGMHLFSRFPLVDPQVRFLLDDYVPSIKTGLRLPSGARIDLYGVHPKPPPRQDTARRDAELLIVAREVRAEGAPAIVAGDLNDVAWSRTTRLFQDVSGFLDPRIGRSPYATFNADWPLLRWPLDHVFFEDSFGLLDIAVMEDIGSDHFPLFVGLCHDPAAADAQAEPNLAPSSIDDVREQIREGREEAREE
jgi:endonuclease/exonuclease/phosphatase (EEP) superfamily protein YafD